MWGKRSAERLVEALRVLLCGENDACDPLADLAPYIQGAERCEDLEPAINAYLSWKSLAWAYRPAGPPPSAKKSLILQVLCREGIPMDEAFLRELTQPGEGEGREL